MDKIPQPSLLKGFVLRLRASRCRAVALKLNLKLDSWNPLEPRNFATGTLYWTIGRSEWSIRISNEALEALVALDPTKLKVEDKWTKFRSRLCSRGLFSAFVWVVAERSLWNWTWNWISEIHWRPETCSLELYTESLESQNCTLELQTRHWKLHLQLIHCTAETFCYKKRFPKYHLGPVGHTHPK